MIMVCVKNYKKLKIGDKIDFIPRNKQMTLAEKYEIFPIGAITTGNINDFIYYKDFKEYFCPLKEYRKLKLENLKEKINERQV